MNKASFLGISFKLLILNNLKLHTEERSHIQMQDSFKIFVEIYSQI